MGCKLFVKVSRQFFVIIKFATDVFANNTSLIVVAIIKLVSVRRPRPSIGDKNDMIFAESEFSLKSK